VPDALRTIVIEIEVVKIRLDASSIQPSTIVPLYRTLFCVFISFYFVFFVFDCVLFILILLHVIGTLHCVSVGVRAFAIFLFIFLFLIFKFFFKKHKKY